VRACQRARVLSSAHIVDHRFRAALMQVTRASGAQVARAQQLFATIMGGSKAVQPNLLSFNSMITTFGQMGTTQALEKLKDVVGKVRRRSNSNRIKSNHGRAPRHVRAGPIIQMLEMKINANMDTYVKILRAFDRPGLQLQGLELLDRVRMGAVMEYSIWQGFSS
jgi:hypothetical protein